MVEDAASDARSALNGCGNAAFGTSHESRNTGAREWRSRIQEAGPRTGERLRRKRVAFQRLS